MSRMKNSIHLFSASLLLLSSLTLIAQDPDSIRNRRKPVVISDSTFQQAEDEAVLFEEVSTLDPQRAAILSALFPGLGQVYNKQYWKVPIVVTGMVAFGHFINYNHQVYDGLRNAALLVADGQPNPYAEIINSESRLVQQRDRFRRQRDFMIILGAAFYILQIVDAHVSAHLEEFRINEKLAITIEPSIQPTPVFSQATGFSVILRF